MKLCDCIFSEMHFFLPRRDAARDRARAWGCYMAFPVVKQRVQCTRKSRLFEILVEEPLSISMCEHGC